MAGNMSHVVDVGIVFEDERISHVELLIVSLGPSVVDVVLGSLSSESPTL